MHGRRTVALAVLAAATLVRPMLSAQAPAESAQAAMPTVVFQDVRVFDGKADRLTGPTNVVVEGNVIRRISPAPVTA